jgi:hypothetical protein
MKKWLTLIRGWIRYQLGKCPNCKGEIPNDFYCLICANYGNAKCPDAITCLAWWRRYKEFIYGQGKEGEVVEVDLLPSPSPSPSPSAWNEEELKRIENILREGRASNE